MEGETRATVADIERDRATWRSRCQDLLMTVGASTPEDHDWVQEARWLLSEIDRLKAKLEGEDGG